MSLSVSAPQPRAERMLRLPLCGGRPGRKRPAERPKAGIAPGGPRPVNRAPCPSVRSESTSYPRYPRYPQHESLCATRADVTACECGGGPPLPRDRKGRRRSPGQPSSRANDEDQAGGRRGRLTKPPPCGRCGLAPFAKASVGTLRGAARLTGRASRLERKAKRRGAALGPRRAGRIGKASAWMKSQTGTTRGLRVANVSGRP
jgi:hypothetical protein